jgi:DNA-binding NtrC family response regulator
MENYVDAYPTIRREPIPELRLPKIAENRVHALKTLVELVLHELETLQEITNVGDRNGDEPVSLPDEIVEFEVRLIRNALIQTRGNQRSAAALLGIKHTTLHAKLRRYNIDPRTFTVGAAGRRASSTNKNFMEEL